MGALASRPSKSRYNKLDESATSLQCHTQTNKYTGSQGTSNALWRQYEEANKKLYKNIYLELKDICKDCPEDSGTNGCLEGAVSTHDSKIEAARLELINVPESLEHIKTNLTLSEDTNPAELLKTTSYPISGKRTKRRGTLCVIDTNRVIHLDKGSANDMPSSVVRRQSSFPAVLSHLGRSLKTKKEPDEPLMYETRETNKLLS